MIGLPLTMIAEARLVLTDDLVRESLKRTKQLQRNQEHGTPTAAAPDGSDVTDGQ